MILDKKQFDWTVDNPLQMYLPQHSTVEKREKCRCKNTLYFMEINYPLLINAYNGNQICHFKRNFTVHLQGNC